MTAMSIRAGAANTTLDPLAVIEWLSGDECHELDDAGLIAELGRRLREAGLSIDRLTLHLRTLHPEIVGRTIAWAPNEPVEIHDRDFGVETSGAFVGSPLQKVMKTRETAIVRPADTGGADWMQIDVFRGRRLVEIVLVPLCTSAGPVSVAAFCTARRSGFTSRERDVLDRIVPALRTACELRILRKVELTLLDTYIGATTAQRILSGHIRRGETECLEAALMLCDLRGFTELSNRLPGKRVIELLDAYFDRVIPSIVAAGGEVLKFMGDAVLAFFHRDVAADAAAAALEGACGALAALAAFTPPDATLSAGIALHYGTVSYGNIGSGRRLDFTVIGPDVNLVSRIASACSTTGSPLLMSREFATMIGPRPVRLFGRHQLRGFAEPVELYTLNRTEPMASAREQANEASEAAGEA
jgi:adenylate cyclase